MARKSKVGRLPPARRKRPPRRAVFKKYSRQPRKPPLYVGSILAWADAHRGRAGWWPIASSGTVQDAPWETWHQVDDALRQGYRGCRPGGSLAKLLLKHRGKKPRKGYLRRPRMTVPDILAWADAYHERTGRWPAAHSPGRVAKGRDDTWFKVDHALRNGTRGLPGRDSLPQVLLRYRDVRRAGNRPRLTVKQILAWADAHRARTGRWPSTRSGPVEGEPGESWVSIHAALEHGCRGLPRGYTLATLLSKYRGHRVRRNLPPYTNAGILAWADAYQRRNGRWPTLKSGPIYEARGETWNAVESALANGRRGQPGGDSLSQFLIRHGRRPRRNKGHHRARHRLLSIEQILGWADAYRRRNDCWPMRKSGPVAGVRDETWLAVDTALRSGLRGLARGSSLARLLEERRGVARWAGQRPAAAASARE